MSDEYASTGYKGSLVNDSMTDPTLKPSTKPQKIAKKPSDREGSSDFETGNYPTEGDTTASGGYGSPTNVWSDRAQRGNTKNIGPYQQTDVGLVDQSISGGPLRGKFQDAAQGKDVNARRDYKAQQYVVPQAGEHAKDAGSRGEDQLNPTFDEQNEEEKEL
ncbi:hypothetical protein Hypma_006225 [Hypsizygus marmoreus]|uniref:Uncharacterized protein n=1 Tax=Hypsizygus marmoreus TaxID=39966 RepID=A0A369JVN5_HYPMA|nr:hypothetical protein Hypma_006225 [Hypsizygus marmoreus]